MKNKKLINLENGDDIGANFNAKDIVKKANEDLQIEKENVDGGNIIYI